MIITVFSHGTMHSKQGCSCRVTTFLVSKMELVGFLKLVFESQFSIVGGKIANIEVQVSPIPNTVFGVSDIF